MSKRTSASANTSDAHICAGTRRQPAQERARATVAAITEAASQLLIEQGYDRVSTNRIAQRAGVSIGSLYQYFSSKEAIYAAIVDAHVTEMHEISEHALRIMADTRVPFSTALRQVLDAFVSVHTRDDDLMRAIERELIQVFPHWRGSKAGDAQVVAAVARILAQRSDCQPADTTVAALILITVCQGVVKWLLHEAPPGTDCERYLAATVAVCCQAAGAQR